MSATKAFAAELAGEIAAHLAEARVQKRVYSLHDAAVYLGCSEDQVRHLAASGALRTVSYDRYKRFDVRDLDLFIDREKR